MKKRIITFITLLLIFAVSYGGSGVNMYFYCCDDCRSEGLSAIVYQKCEEVHHHHHMGGLIVHYTSDDSCVHQLTENPDFCGVERISVSWDSHTNVISHLQPAILNLNPLFIHIAEKTEALSMPVQELRDHGSSQKPPNLSKLTYFSLLTTLII